RAPRRGGRTCHAHRERTTNHRPPDCPLEVAFGPRSSVLGPRSSVLAPRSTIRRMPLRERKEWKFFAVLPRADAVLAASWWVVLILRGSLPAVFAVAAGMLVGAVQD